MFDFVKNIKNEIYKGFIGKETIIENLLVGFLSGLHTLIEDIPGVGKTTLAKCLATATGLDFGRIQFTPDLLPGDILGINVWNHEKREFIFKPGGIMHQFLLADEINRASARTQSSLLEAMQEKKITIDGKTYSLPDPFFVIATQNPTTFSGTFLLPEAELDRFGISFSIGYPEKKDEEIIMGKNPEKDATADIDPMIDAKGIIEIREHIRSIHIDPKIKEYILQISENSRKNKDIKLGLSPRGTQHIYRAAQAWAFMRGNDFIIPEDVYNAAFLVIPHKLILSAQAKMENIDNRTAVSRLVSGLIKPTGL